MAYDNLVSRTDAAALIPEEVSRDLVKRMTDMSAVLELFRRIPVSRGQLRMPILSALPLAYWVNGDTGLKQTSEVNWANKFLNIEEIAVIVPIPDNVAADIEVEIWDEAMPYMTEAAGRTLDEAVFFGVNAPASFPSNVYAASVAAGNFVNEGTAASAGGFMADIDLAIGLVEADGFDPTGYVASRSARGKFRAARNTQGDRLDVGRLNQGLNELDGLPVIYPMRGLFPAGGAANTNTRLFVGDWSEFVVGVRQDIKFDLFREGVIQDNTGSIVYNLMQQDMSAMRLTFRVGWQVSNNIRYDALAENGRYPAAVLRY